MTGHLPRNQRTTAITAGVIGNAIEWYDFALYGFMASILADLFFPNEDHLVSLIATYGVFAVGFIMRPLGSVTFGWLGDTIGRSRTLLISVAMMALPTLLLGLLPSHASIGVAAPILLILIRMLQGLSVGGEFSTSVTYLVETAPAGRRGLAGSWANTGSIGGMLLGSAAAAATINVVPSSALESWGWRVPFLFGGVLGTVGLLLRKNLPDSPHFARYERAHCPNSSIKEAFICNRLQMIQGFLFASGYGVLFYLALVYLPTWISEVAGITLGAAMHANTVTMAVLLPVIPVAGWISDRYMRRTHLVTTVFLLLGGIGPALFLWMRDGGVLAMWAGQIILGVLLGLALGAAPAIFTELFPEDDRLSGYSIVFNVGLGVVGGLTPMIASWSILVTGLDIAPAGLLMAGAIIGAVGLVWIRDRSREPLRTTCRVPVHEAVNTTNGIAYTERGQPFKTNQATKYPP